MVQKDILASSRRLKRKRIILKSLVFLLVLVFLSAGVIVFSHWDKFRIQKISIKKDPSSLGVEELSKYATDYLNKKYLGIFPMDNIFLFPKGSMKNDILKDFPRIKSVILDRDFPQTLFMEIEERKSEALLCYNEDCGFVDETGFVFEKAPFFSGSVFAKLTDKRTNAKKISIGERFLDKDKLALLISFKNFLKEKNINIDEIIIKDDGIYNMLTSFGWRILLNENSEAKSAFENLKIALEEKIKDNEENLEYIDLRFGNKIFYKFK